MSETLDETVSHVVVDERCVCVRVYVSGLYSSRNPGPHCSGAADLCLASTFMSRHIVG